MKRFLIRSAMFLVPLAMLIVGLEFAVRAIPNNYKQHHQHLTLRGDSIQVLILGNSHAFNGVDPLIFPVPTYNAANISQDHRRDLAILRRYTRNLPALRHVVVAASYASICSALEKGAEPWRVKNYVIYMDMPEEASKMDDHAELLNGKPGDVLNDLIRWVLRGEDHMDCNPMGGALRPAGGPLQHDYTLRAAQRHTCAEESRMQRNAADLTELVRLAGERGVHVHLFFPPAAAAYRKLLAPAQLAAIRRLGHELAARNSHVSWHDLFDDPRFTDSDFVNADHLQQVGCRKLTAILCADVGYVPLPDSLATERSRP